MLSPTALSAVAIVAAYFCGSAPFGLLIGWSRGIDLRQHGSRNIGATNAARVLGGKWGALVLLLDVVKGVVGTGVVPLVAGVGDRLDVRVGCGVAAIVGHMFPCWLGFRGGKGVATSLGVIAVLAPWGTVIAFGTFALVFALSRIVSLSSILASLAFGIGQMALLSPQPFAREKLPLALFSLAAPLLVIVRHRENIGRLWRGEEKKFRAGESPSASSQPATPPHEPPSPFTA